MNKKIYASFLSVALLAGASAAVAQNNTTGQSTGQVRTVSNGQKLKVKGVITDRQGDTLTVRDETGSNVQVLLTSSTSVKAKKFFGTGKTYLSSFLTRGLFLEVQGRGDNSGALVAEKVRFGEDDLRAAQALDARVNPVEDRVAATEQNAQRLSGQLDELVAISNAARGGAAAAQDTADAAIQGVNATNSRITSLDEFEVQSNATVTFRTGSAVLSPEAKTQLDTLAQSAQTTRGFIMEITGFADSTGDTTRNRALSQRRAEAVIQYLVETHGVPLRRILPSYGFGESNSVADNTTRDGRAQNRRVEVKLLVSRGLTQSVEVQSTPTTRPQQ